MCDYSDTYNVAKRTITGRGTNNDKKRNKNLIFSNNTPFRFCMSKLTEKFIGNAEDLHILMQMYNQLGHDYLVLLQFGLADTYFYSKQGSSLLVSMLFARLIKISL